MKLVLTYLLAIVFLSPALAQRIVDAKEIIAKIDQKEPISYENITITGDLDLTSLSNRKQVDEGQWNDKTDHYRSVVEVPLSFRHCTFQGKCLAYRAEQKFNGNNKVFNTNFKETAVFENCTFEDDASFKYTHFHQQALFTNSNFRSSALFKYAHFKKPTDFSGSRFQRVADFKYTKFNEETTFAKSRFFHADFKYTKFEKSASFQNTRFNTADFKYTHLPQGSSFDEAIFDGVTDFKYATLDGRKFSPKR